MSKYDKLSTGFDFYATRCTSVTYITPPCTYT